MAVSNASLAFHRKAHFHAILLRHIIVNYNQPCNSFIPVLLVEFAHCAFALTGYRFIMQRRRFLFSLTQWDGGITKAVKLRYNLIIDIVRWYRISWLVFNKKNDFRAIDFSSVFIHRIVRSILSWFFNFFITLARKEKMITKW